MHKEVLGLAQYPQTSVLGQSDAHGGSRSEVPGLALYCLGVIQIGEMRIGTDNGGLWNVILWD